MFETVSGTYVTFPMEPKAMHDEMGASFDKEYARMSTNLGTQLPVPKTNNANMTPFMYTDPTTEWMNAAIEPVSPVLGDGTQLWKISHNGVDMHPIHFHIFDVQVINRVGWDGQIRLPAPTELGWKDTVRISPLEDTIVAMRPWTPPMPFAIPFSFRALNPAIPIGSGFGFTNIDPITQTPLVPPTLNSVVSFAWEYVWHCHILSHEENDMMRPIVLNVISTIPPAFAAAPTVTAVNTGTTGNRVSWVDPTPVNYVTQAGFSGTKSGTLINNLEIGFRIERATSATGAYSVVGTARANQTTLPDDTSRASATTYYRYRVVAFNEAGTSTSPFGSDQHPGDAQPDRRDARGPGRQRRGRHHHDRLDEEPHLHRDAGLPGHPGPDDGPGRVRVLPPSGYGRDGRRPGLQPARHLDHAARHPRHGRRAGLHGLGEGSHQHRRHRPHRHA